MRKTKNIYKVKTRKRNKIIVEEVNPDELNEVWKKFSDIDQNF